MDNQHRRILGYRELTAEEIALINEIKALGPQIEAVCDKVQAHVDEQYKVACTHGEVAITRNGIGSTVTGVEEVERLTQADPRKWRPWGSDGMQASLMYLTRAVAQPTFF